MTNQEFFDTTLNHLRKQGMKSYGAKGCMYRGPNNTKCAIGFHIPDNLYKPEMEGKSVHNLLHDFPELKPLFEGVGEPLLDDMQFLHDNYMHLLEPKMEEIAKAHRLTCKELDHFSGSHRPD